MNCSICGKPVQYVNHGNIVPSVYHVKCITDEFKQERIMNNVHVSNVCRVAITPELAALAVGAGVFQIPEDLLLPRQIKINDGFKGTIEQVKLVRHRDTMYPVINHYQANRLFASGMASYVSQSLLVYSMNDYLSDSDVKGDSDEFLKALTVSKMGCDLVIVAVIGEYRSAVSVCRNIVSGCQKLNTIIEDCKGAIETSNVFLIED